VGLGSKNMHFTSLIIHGQLFALVTLVWVQIDGDSSQQKKNKGKDRENKKERIRMKVFLWSIKKRPFDYATGGCHDHDREGQMK
jgi:hypothetical protein